MDETRLFGGRVRKLTLPEFRPPIPRTPPPKRLLLPQGELAHCYDGELGIQYIAFVELLAGAVRGNHFHNAKQEWLYVGSGALRLSVEDMQTKQRETFTLQAGQMAVIDCGVAHALQTVQPGFAVEFSPARFDAADCHPFPLVPNQK